MRNGDRRYLAALLVVAALLVAAAAGCVRYGYQELPDAEVTWPLDLPPTFDGALDGPADASQDRPVDAPQVADKQVTDKQVTDKQVTDKQVTDKQVAPLDQQQPDAGGSFKLAWSRRAGGSGYDYGAGVAVDSAGNVYVSGTFTGSADFEGQTLIATGAGDAFVASYNPAGVLRWTRALGGSSDDLGNALAVDVSASSGAIYLAGDFQGSMAVSSTANLVSKGGRDAMLVKLNSATGATLWARGLGGSGQDDGSAVALDGAGNVYLTGQMASAVDLGGGMLPHVGGNDVYVVSFSSSGAHRWSRSFGSTGTEFVDGLAANKAGTGVYVSGAFSSTMAVGTQALVSKGQRDVFLAAFNGSSGASSWAKAFGGATGFDTGRGVTTDGAGNVYLVGEYQGNIAVGSTTLPARGSYDIFVVSYTSTGSLRWSRGFGSSGWDSCNAASWDGANLHLAGSFTGSMKIGGQTLVGQGADGYVASLDSAGAPRWAHSFGGSKYCSAIAVAASGNHAYAAGRFQGTATIGTTPHTAKGTDDIFVVKLQP